MPRVAEQWVRTILAALYRESTTTRAEILKLTGLNPASASHAFQQLVKAGVVLKIGELHSKAGRRRELLRLNPEAGYLVAVDLEASPIRFALTNLVGDIRFRWEEEVDWRKNLDVSRIVNGVQVVCRSLHPDQFRRVLAVGISRPGVRDAQGNVTAVNLGWHRFSLEQQLRETLELPFFIENTARSFVLAEHQHGRAQHSEHCIYVEIGKGVGAGVVLDGSFFERKVEFGHLTVDLNASDPCRCGKIGCIEAITSGPNLVRQYLEQVGAVDTGSVSVAEVLERARRADPVALSVVDRVASTLALGISHLIILFDPELIILGGYVPAAEDLFMPRIRKQLQRHIKDWMFRDCELTVSGLGADIGLKGAASRAFYSVVADSTLLAKLCRLNAVAGRAGATKRTSKRIVAVP